MPTLRLAEASDLFMLHDLVESAYRGERARKGWTYESDLVEGQRISAETLAAIIADPEERILLAHEGQALVACIQVSQTSKGIAYLGLLAVDPALQAGGIGKQMIAAAEDVAVSAFRAVRMEMAVLSQRTELIAYYQRRGYALTGERRPFPIPMDPPFALSVLAKPLNR